MPQLFSSDNQDNFQGSRNSLDANQLDFRQKVFDPPDLRLVNLLDRFENYLDYH